MKEPKTKGKKYSLPLMTAIMIALVFGTFLMSYIETCRLMERDCVERMQEATYSISTEVKSLFESNNMALDSIADQLSYLEEIDGEQCVRVLNKFTNYLQAKRISILLPDDRIVTMKGVLEPGTLRYSVETKHVWSFSYKSESNLNKGQIIFRQYVPVVIKGKTAGLLYAVYDTDSIRSNNAKRAYDGQIDYCIIDRRNGDAVVDTRPQSLVIPRDVRDLMTSGATGSYLQPGKTKKEAMYYCYSPVSDCYSIITMIQDGVAMRDLHVYKTRVMTMVLAVLAILIVFAIFVFKKTRHDTAMAIENENLRTMALYQKELEEAKLRAEVASEAKTTFLFNMSHDIRTPMNAITGYTAMAKSNIMERQKLESYLDKIDVAGKQLLSLVNQVLDMARIESGKVVLQSIPLDVEKFIANMAGVVQINATMKGLKLIHECKNIKHSVVYADEVRLNELILNVVGNSIKYTQIGSVSLTVEELDCDVPDHASYVFTIDDTGMGMSEEFLKHLFDTFTREENSTISGIEGTGLGMSIVKRLVELMGGHIDVQSEKGEGTTTKIYLTFQVCTEDIAAPISESQVISESKLHGKRALLVEDNEMNREIALNILEIIGLEAEEAENGQEAVDKVTESAPGYYDFIIMDVQMPIMDGYEATHRIRELEDPLLAKIPIIAMTANAFAEDKQAAKEHGMNAHVAKPINRIELIQTLESFI